MEDKQDKIVESLESNFSSFQSDYKKLVSDYKRKSKRLDRIIKQSDKQQLKVVKLNEELDSYKNELELKVIEKTKELHQLNQSLEQRVKDEVAANRIKEQRISEQSKFVQIGELMSNIAHHWRQPLSAISTAASGVIVGKQIGISDEEEDAKALESIVESTQFLSAVIEDFAKFVNDSQKSENIDFNVQDSINQSLNIILSSLNNNKINIIKQFGDESAIINSIPSKLANIILNIIKNAQDALLKQSSNENKNITIKLSHVKKYIVISIKDNASGIEENILPKIFDPYFTTKHQSQGTGLGLFTSREDMEKYLKGKIEVNTSSEGTEFSLIMPKNI